MNAQERLLERVEQEIKFLSRFDIPSDCRHIRLLSDLRGEIQRQDRHLERLGSGEDFESTMPFVTEGDWAISELCAMKVYARTHRFEDE